MLKKKLLSTFAMFFHSADSLDTRTFSEMSCRNYHYSYLGRCVESHP